MWFQVLSLMIGVPCVLKGVVGLTFARKFYRWRESQYAADRPPNKLFLAPLALAGTVAVTWWATLAHYAPWGWVVTVFINVAAIVGTANLIWWRQHQSRALSTVVRPKVRRIIDLLLVCIGTGFITLAIAAY